LDRQGTEHYHHARYQDALQVFGRAYATYPDPNFKLCIGQAQRKLGNYRQAAEAYEAYVTESGSLPRVVQLASGRRTQTPNPVVYTFMGDCFLMLQDHRARQMYQRYIQAAPNGRYVAQARRAIETGTSIEDQMRRDPRVVQRARSLHDSAVRLYERGQYRQAAELFLNGYGMQDTVHEFLLNAACCYQDARMWTEAVQNFQRYLRTTGAESRAYAFLAECQHHAGHHADAVQAYRDYLSHEANGEYSRDARDYIYTITHGQTDGSLFVPTDQDRQRAEAAFRNGMQHHAAGHHQDALREFNNSHEAMATRHALFMLAFTYEQLQQWQEALTRYETLLRGGDYGDEAVAHLNAAECLMRLNRYADAEGHARAYIQRAAEAELPDEQTNVQSARTIVRICEERTSGGSTG
jgi:tetratricopeptide (TPR) repeat protein